MTHFRLCKKGTPTYLKMVLTTLLFALTAQLTIAQKKIVAKQLITSNRGANAMEKVFKKQQTFSIDMEDLGNYIKENKGTSINLDFEFDGLPSMPIALSENNILAEDYSLTVASEGKKETFGKPTCRTYSGVLTNDNSSVVYLTISKKTIFGFIKGNGKYYFIEPLKDFDKYEASNSFVLYEREDVLPQQGAVCGVTEAAERLTASVNENNNRGTATGTCKIVRLAIASDVTMLERYGDAAAVAEHNISITNTMVGLYSYAQIGTGYLQFRIAGQYVATSASNNPSLPLYDGDDSGTILDNFAAWGNAGNFIIPDYSIGQLWTARDITFLGRNGNIGLAYLSAVCGTDRYQVNEDVVAFSLASLATLAAHETGHNLGAVHDGSSFPYIMAPSISNIPATEFSPESLFEMSVFLGTASCLQLCSRTGPRAAFNLPKVNCGLGPINLNNQSTGAVNAILWQMPGGIPSTSTANNVAVQYTTPGYKTVTLSAFTLSNFRNSVVREMFVDNPVIAGCRTVIPGILSNTSIGRFRLADLKHDESVIFLGGRYKDYTCSNITALKLDTTYSVTAAVGYGGGFANDFNNKMQMFIDFNNDGDFTDEGEAVYSSTDCTQVSFNFPLAIPGSVPVMNRLLRLRIIAMPCDLPVSNGCAIPSAAQIEDYGVVFEGPRYPYYVDYDLDGFGANDVVYLHSSLPPTGFSLNNMDCNDNNAAINPATIWVLDKDKDGYYIGEPVSSCTSPGVGYAMKTTQQAGDCNDNDAAITLPGSWIIDGDADGYYLGNAVVSCTSPGASYLLKTTELFGDCNDVNASVNPGAVEVCGNGLDDNCNGAIDEGNCFPCQNGSNLLITNITFEAAQLNWTAVANAVQWQVRYKAVKQGSKWVDIWLTGNKRSTTITGLQSNQKYIWQIRAKCGNTFTSYSDALEFTTLGQPMLSRAGLYPQHEPNKERSNVEDLIVAFDKLVTYPNPTSGLLNLTMRMSSKTNAIADITVKDIAGRTVYSNKIMINDGLLNKNIQLPLGASSGIYFVDVTSGLKRYHSKIVLMK